MPAQPNSVAIYSVDPGQTTGCATILANTRLDTVQAILRRAKAKGNLMTWNETGSHTQQAWRITRDIVDFFFNVHVERELVQATKCFIVIEGFQLWMASADLSPVRVTAGIETLLSHGGEWNYSEEYYTKQEPVEKGFCDDNMLKRCGLWRSKSPHERDAVRHIAAKLDKILKGE